MKISGAEFVIRELGGKTQVATKLSKHRDKRVPFTTIQGWEIRKSIPQKHWDALIAVAAAEGKTFTPATFVTDVEIDDDNTEAA